MNKTDALWGNPVASLQTMLRQLCQVYDFLPVVPIDGIFGELTLEAVLRYQQEKFPPVTGIVNKEVWEAIREDYVRNQPNLEKPRVLRAFPEGEDTLSFGNETSEIALFQMMFQLLSQQIAQIKPETPSGVFTQTLKDNVIWLQEVSGLPVTGELDRQSWDRLARLYEVYVTKA